MRLRTFFASLLPGIFLLGFNVGTGSVTAMAKAGADHGMQLLWAVVLSCLITWRLIALYGRFTIVTGETALGAFRRHLHPGVAWFFIVGLTLNVSGSIMGVMGVIARVTSDAVARATGVAGSPLAVAVGVSAAVYGVFWLGRTAWFERVMAGLVAGMGACFLANVVVTPPPLGDVLAGFRPSLPAGVAGDDVPLLVASLVGTTVFSGLFILRTTLVKEAGWTLADYRRQETDAGVSALLMLLLSAAIMAAGAGALHPQGATLTDPAQMSGLLEPVAGRTAALVFALGVIAAGLSSQLPNVLLLPWLLGDYHGRRRDLRRPSVRLIVLGLSLLGLVVPLFDARPVLVMIASQAFGAVLLPATVGCLWWLGNRAALMREHRFGGWDNVTLAAVFAFACFMALLGLRGVGGLLRGFITS